MLGHYTCSTEPYSVSEHSSVHTGRSKQSLIHASVLRMHMVSSSKEKTGA